MKNKITREQSKIVVSAIKSYYKHLDTYCKALKIIDAKEIQKYKTSKMADLALTFDEEGVLNPVRKEVFVNSRFENTSTMLDLKLITEPVIAAVVAGKTNEDISNNLYTVLKSKGY